MARTKRSTTAYPLEPATAADRLRKHSHGALAGAALALVFTAAVPAAAQNLLVNGDF